MPISPQNHFVERLGPSPLRLQIREILEHQIKSGNDDWVLYDIVRD